MLTPELDDFIVRMPKVELHLHLEGSVAPQTLLELAQRNEVEIPARDVEGVKQLFRFRDFREFLIVYMALVQAIVDGGDFERLAYELGCELAQQNVVYAEVMLSPVQHIRRNVNMLEAIAGTAAGFARAEREFGRRWYGWRWIMGVSMGRTRHGRCWKQLLRACRMVWLAGLSGVMRLATHLSHLRKYLRRRGRRVCG